MPGKPIHLTILRRGEINIVDLADVNAVIPRSEIRVSGAFIEDLCAEVEKIAIHGLAAGGGRGAAAVSLETQGTADTLRELGQLIFAHLLPASARQRLRESATSDLYLRLDDKLLGVPWELAFDGESFVANKFRVGRQVITERAVRSAPVRPPATKTLRALLVWDPTEKLRGAAEEIEQLRGMLEHAGGVRVELIGGRAARRISLLQAMNRADIVHFAGHSVFDADRPELSGWVLSEGVLTAGEISKLLNPPLLVFSNSCSASATADWDGFKYEGTAFGLGSAFLTAGVANFVGAFWVIHDREAVELAARFYGALLAGSSLGEALRRARVERFEGLGRGSLTWASHILYGDPGFTFHAEGPVARPALTNGGFAGDAGTVEVERVFVRSAGEGRPARVPRLGRKRAIIGFLALILALAAIAGYGALVLWRDAGYPRPPSSWPGGTWVWFLGGGGEPPFGLTRKAPDTGSASQPPTVVSNAGEPPPGTRSGAAGSSAVAGGLSELGAADFKGKASRLYVPDQVTESRGAPIWGIVPGEAPNRAERQTK